MNKRVIHRCYDSHGEWWDVSEDADCLGLVELLSMDSGVRISLQLEQAEDVRDSMADVIARLKDQAKEDTSDE